jgi:hypothetical protein
MRKMRLAPIPHDAPMRAQGDKTNPFAFLLVALALLRVAGGCSSRDTASQRRCRPGQTGIGLGTTINICPQVTSVSAVPSPAPVGSDVHLTATADDPDSKTLAFLWSPADEEPFSAAGPNATYRCTAPGIVKMDVTVTDGECDDTDQVAFLCTCAIDAATCDAGP